MEILKYIVWGLTLFFAGSWAFGMFVRPDFRLKCNVVTVIFWWAEIALAALGFYSVFHLLWLMPISLFIPGAVQQAELKKRFAHAPTAVIFAKSAVPVSLALAALIYFSYA